MPTRRTRYNAYAQAAKEIARREKMMLAQQKRLQSVQEKAVKQRAKQAKEWEKTSKQTAAMQEKAAKERHLEDRIEETADLNAEVTEKLAQLKNILARPFSVDGKLLFSTLKMKEENRQFVPPRELANPAPLPSRDPFFYGIKAPGIIESLVPGAKLRYQQTLQEAETRYNTACIQHHASEIERNQKLNNLFTKFQTEYEEHRALVRQRNLEVEQLVEGYTKGEQAAVETLCSLALESSVYPDDFAQEFQLVYIPNSKQLVVEYELPPVEVVPAVVEYKYVKTRDTIDEKARKREEINSIYQDVVAAICLRTLYEIFRVDYNKNIEVVAFNGVILTTDLATGQDVTKHLISMRVSREKFAEINVQRVDKLTCLRNLGASVSPSPAEMVAVRPVIEFDMVDKRFIEQGDILSGLNNRPNIMELNPSEFEQLVSNMFQKMGFEAKLTRASRDGGVDAVVFDKRPLMGGKVVIQAKRYKNTVGVAAVRDLYGTMINEGANKGILVTTSSYGPDAYQFAGDKPIELVDGAGLLHYLNEVGLEARIIMPPENPS